MILALDTSTDQASVALCIGSQPVAEVSWRAANHHSRHVMDVIRHALGLTGASAANLTALAVAIGPGSFNGLRVGLSIAKGMALARDLPLVGVSTLDVIASQSATAGRAVFATVPAGRGEVACARYRAHGGELMRETEYLRARLAEAVGLLREGDVVAGPGRCMVAEAARQAGADVAVESAARDLSRASFLAELARRYMDAGGGTQIDDVEPLYLRRPSAEEKRLSAAQE
jgi:tRNA threonylcarbamoyladenosine biosynthesis protein TsaB